ncbi:hypothetical protein J7643_14155 [bacterium]|nr:hypothetical protein [bacterium]
MRKHHFGKVLLALVGAATVVLPAGPALANWQLTGTSSNTYFVPDVYQGRKLANSAVDTRYVPAGTQRFDGAKQLVSKTPREVRTDLKNPSKERLDNGIYEVYKLVKFDLWNDAQYQTPWTLYNMKQKQSQTTNFFVFEWRDQISGAIIRDNDPNFEVGPWTNIGSTEKDTVAATGADLWPQLVKEDFRSENRDVMLARVPLSLASNEAAKAKSATFLSDSGSGGNATAVSGSQKRVTFKADEAIVSETKKETTGGSGGIGSDNLIGGVGTGVGGSTTGNGNANGTGNGNATPAPSPTPTPAPVVSTDKGFAMEDWYGTWQSKGKSGNGYDYQIVIKKYSNKTFQYNFDSWFNADKFDRMPATSFSYNGAFTSDKKEQYKDSDGWLNCELKLERDKSGKLKLKGKVTIYETDLLGFKTKNKKTYDVELTK